MKNLPRVSVIIINWNGKAILENCLISLEKCDYPKVEVLIVDNGSIDGSEDLQFYNKFKLDIKLIKNKSNMGFAPANNQAYKLANGKYILLLNNDTEVKPNLLKVLVEKMEEEPFIGGIQPKIFMLDKKGYLDNAGSYITNIGFFDHWGFGEKDREEFNETKYIFSAKGACLMLRKEIVDKIGLFDSDFISYFEESDLCWRIWLAGYKVVYYPKTYIFHKVGFTIKRQDVLNINFHYYKNRIRSLIINLEFKNLFTILFLHFLVSIGIAVLFLIKGNLKNALMILRAILWNVTNIDRTLKLRKKVQKYRKVSDDDLFIELRRPINWGKFINDFRRVEKDIKGK